MKETETREGCFIAIVLLLLLPVSWVWYGFVLSKLWLWLIVPTFALPTLNGVQAIGLFTVVSFLTHQRTPDDKKSPIETLISALMWLAIYPTLTLLSGYIISRYL